MEHVRFKTVPRRFYSDGNRHFEVHLYKKRWFWWDYVESFDSTTSAWAFVDSLLEAQGERVIYYEHTHMVRTRVMQDELSHVVAHRSS